MIGDQRLVNQRMESLAILNEVKKCGVSLSLSKAMCDKAIPAMLRQAQHDTLLCSLNVVK